MTGVWSRAFFIAMVGAGFLISTPSKASEYKMAVSAAKQAFMIQSGLNNQLSLVQKYSENKVRQVVQDFDIETELAVALFTYKTLKDKSVSFRYRDKSVLLNPNLLSFTFAF